MHIGSGQQLIEDVEISLSLWMLSYSGLLQPICDHNSQTSFTCKGTRHKYKNINPQGKILNKVVFIYIHITHSSRLTVGDGSSNWISFKVEAYLYVFPLKKGKNYNSSPVLAVCHHLQIWRNCRCGAF